MGSFGEVRLASHKSTQQKYAVKIMNMSTMRSLQEVQGIEREVRVHSELHHANIVTFYDSFQQGSMVYIVLEYATHGNLFQHIFKNKAFSEKHAFKYFYQTCLAISYLHSINVVHRDLKPENILLDEQLNVKLCDFGWCTEDIENPRSTFCGTYEYMAPEIVFRQQYDYRIDIWALGVLLFELLHGCAPFKGKTFPEIQKKVEKGDIRFSESVSSSAKSLICRVLQANPERRISMDDILNHKWIQQMSIECQFGHHYIESLQGKSKQKDNKNNINNAKNGQNNNSNTQIICDFQATEKRNIIASAGTSSDDIPKRQLITGQAKRVDTDSANKENLSSVMELSARKHNNTLHKTTASISKTPIISTVDNNDQISSDRNHANAGDVANKTNSKNMRISESCASLSANKMKVPLNTDISNVSAHKLMVNNNKISNSQMNEENMSNKSKGLLCFTSKNGDIMGNQCNGNQQISNNSSSNFIKNDCKQLQVQSNSNTRISQLQESKQNYPGDGEYSSSSGLFPQSSQFNNNIINDSVSLLPKTQRSDGQVDLVNRLFGMASPARTNKATTVITTNNSLSSNQTTNQQFNNTEQLPQNSNNYNNNKELLFVLSKKAKSNILNGQSTTSIGQIQSNFNNNNNISINHNDNNNHQPNNSMNNEILTSSMIEPSCFSLFGCLEAKSSSNNPSSKDIVAVDQFSLKRPNEFNNHNDSQQNQQQQVQQHYLSAKQSIHTLGNNHISCNHKNINSNQVSSSRSNSLVSFSTSRSSHEQQQLLQQQSSQSVIPTKLISLKPNNQSSNSYSGTKNHSISTHVSKQINRFDSNNSTNNNNIIEGNGINIRPRIANSYQLENTFTGNTHSNISTNNNNNSTDIPLNNQPISQSFNNNNNNSSRNISRTASKTRTPNSLFESNSNNNPNHLNSNYQSLISSANNSKGFGQVLDQQQLVLNSLIQQQKSLQESLNPNNNLSNSGVNQHNNNGMSSSSKRGSSRMRIFDNPQIPQSRNSSNNQISASTRASLFLKPANIPAYTNYARIAL